MKKKKAAGLPPKEGATRPVRHQKKKKKKAWVQPQVA